MLDIVPTHTSCLETYPTNICGQSTNAQESNLIYFDPMIKHSSTTIQEVNYGGRHRLSPNLVPEIAEGMRWAARTESLHLRFALRQAARNDICKFRGSPGA